MPTHESGQIMTMDELSAYLRISKSTLYKLAVGNKIPGTKIGKRWRFHKDAIDEWVKRGSSASISKSSSRIRGGRS